MSHAFGPRARVRLRPSQPGDDPLRGISCILLAFLAFLATPALAGDVYRTVDAHGVVTYSDRPENDHSQLIHVETEAPATSSPAAQPRPAQSADSDGAADKQPGTAAAGKAPPQPTAAELAAQRQKNCKIARQRQQSYANAHRLYRKTPDGGRQYLDSKQIDEARARAAADVEKWCG